MSQSVMTKYLYYFVLECITLRNFRALIPVLCCIDA